MIMKNYKHGKIKYKTYLKKCGSGYEVGVLFLGRPLFVSNFIMNSEARTWFLKINSEITSFSKKYWITNKSPINFYRSFLGAHLKKTYYTWLNKCFSKHNRLAAKKMAQNLRQYRSLKLKQSWLSQQRTTCKQVLKKAA